MKLYIILFFLAISNLSLADEFNYKDTHSWAKHWPACGGRRQSPIDISIPTADYSRQNMTLKLKNYHIVPRAMRLTNDGHALKVAYQWDNDSQIPTTSGGGLPGAYRLDSLYFHWNAKGIEGSEHTFNGSRGIMEMHYLHYNTKYRSVEEALHHDDGFLIMADVYFVEPLAHGSYLSPILHQFFDEFIKVPHPGSSINIGRRFSLLSIAPPGASDIVWIVYPGSITVPPCTENVIWLVNTYYHFVDIAQLQRIQNTVRFLHHDDHNFRDIQESNGRKQYAMYTEIIQSE